MNKKKFCSFYVSEYHLLTILLPYIDEQIKNNQNLEVVLEEDMIDSVKKYIKRNERYNTNKIIKLDWKKAKKDDFKIKEDVDVAIIIGKEEFIKKVNYINEENVTLKEFVNCYNIETLSNLNEVVKEHSFVLKTSGLCEFKKSSHNEQKRKTIQTQI